MTPKKIPENGGLYFLILEGLLDDDCFGIKTPA
jgi:hypothetical protein